MAQHHDDLDSDFDSMGENDSGSESGSDDDNYGPGNSSDRDSPASSTGGRIGSMVSNFASMNVQHSAPSPAPAPAPLARPAFPPVPANGKCHTCGRNPVASGPFCTYTCKERWERSAAAAPPPSPQTAAAPSAPSAPSRGGGGGRSSAPSSNSGLCVVCGIKPVHGPYPTCGLSCANALKSGGGRTNQSSGGGRSSAASSNGMCAVCGVKPVFSKNGKTYPTCGMTCAGIYQQQGGGNQSSGGGRGGGNSNQNGMCQVCGVKPAFSKNGVTYPTCGMTCKAKYESGNYSAPQQQQSSYYSSGGGGHGRGGGGGGGASQPRQLCVICNKKPVHSTPGSPPFVTCGLACLEDLCAGKADSTKCDYCHRRPKETGKPQCGNTCAIAAKKACLMCYSRPKLGKYHFCGKTCRKIALKVTPRLCKVPKGHVTWDMVEKKFKAGWKAGGTAPTLQQAYKIVENDTFHNDYTKHKAKVGNEHFLYHGTKRQCTLGEGQTALCTSSTCPTCNILKTSFSMAFSRGGCFGSGIYSSSAVNKASGYTSKAGGTTCPMFLNKVSLGKPFKPTTFGGAQSAPAGYDSVVWDEGGSANESIVYTNNAVRPVFFLLF